MSQALGCCTLRHHLFPQLVSDRMVLLPRQRNHHRCLDKDSLDHNRSGRLVRSCLVLLYPTAHLLKQCWPFHYYGNNTLGFWFASTATPFPFSRHFLPLRRYPLVAHHMSRCFHPSTSVKPSEFQTLEID